MIKQRLVWAMALFFMITTMSVTISGCKKICSWFGCSTSSCCQSDKSVEAGYYVCPMHTNIKENKEGKCSKCGMKLEFKKCERKKEKCPYIDKKGAPPSDAEKN